MFSNEAAQTLLDAAGVFFDEIEGRILNLNDAFYWACADGEEVTDEELPEVAELFFRYGMCGIYYWVLRKRGDASADFQDVSRFVEFVRAEEAIRAEIPDSNKRAYAQRSYTLGLSTPRRDGG